MLAHLASEHGKIQNLDLPCSWSNFNEVEHTSLKCNNCSCSSAKVSGEESKLSDTDTAENICETCSQRCSVENMDIGSPPQGDGHIYKRRKIQNIVALLSSEENAPETTRETPGYYSIGSREDPEDLTEENDNGRSRELKDILPLVPVQKHLRPPLAFWKKNVVRVPSVVLGLEAVTSLHYNSKKFPKAAMNDCPEYNEEKKQRSKYRRLGQMPNLQQHSASNKADAGNACSLSDAVATKSLRELTSAKEFCVAVLRKHGLIGGAWNNVEYSALEVLGGDDKNSFLTCKICGVAENQRKLLICDICEDAFHLSCCTKAKKPQADEWYCQSCFTKRPKPLLDNDYEQSVDDLIASNGGVIPFMLRDTRPYRSRVRIGIDFQAYVPEWSGPTDEDDDDYFKEPAKLDPVQCSRVNGWNCEKLSKPTSIGNWVQCQEVIYKDDDDHEGTICGKWRRAPLFVVQTDDWDCSCAMLWDPIHADCAVPQELETEEVLRHLKYIEMLRPKLLSKQQEMTLNGDSMRRSLLYSDHCAR